MAAADGSFYYQRHRLWTNRTPYMRWGQAWMLRALAKLLLASYPTQGWMSPYVRHSRYGWSQRFSAAGRDAENHAPPRT